MTITTTRDKLRLALGDTDASATLFDDDELDVFLADEANNIPNATLAACYAAAARFARAYDFETDGQAFKRSQMHKAFLDLAKRLEAQGASVSGVSTVRTVDVTKVDGYSDDIANQEVSGGGTVNPRQKFYRVGELDRFP